MYDLLDANEVLDLQEDAERRMMDRMKREGRQGRR